jgi:hypothetical protein
MGVPISRMVIDLLTTELLISSYFNIVKRTMIDMVPKSIMLTLVQYVTPTPMIFGYVRLTIPLFLQIHKG